MKEIDFTPRWYHRTIQRRLARKRRLVWVTLLVAAMGAWTLLRHGQLRLTEHKLAALRASYTQQGPEAKQAQMLLVSLEADRAWERLYVNVAGGAKVHQVLAELSRLLPSSLYLNGLLIRQEDRLVKASGDPQGDQMAGQASARAQAGGSSDDADRLNVELSGQALEAGDVGRLVEAMSSSTLFEDVKLSYSRPELVAGREVYAFELRCRLPQFR